MVYLSMLWGLGHSCSHCRGMAISHGILMHEKAWEVNSRPLLMRSIGMIGFSHGSLSKLFDNYKTYMKGPASCTGSPVSLDHLEKWLPKVAKVNLTRNVNHNVLLMAQRGLLVHRSWLAQLLSPALVQTMDSPEQWPSKCYHAGQIFKKHVFSLGKHTHVW